MFSIMKKSRDVIRMKSKLIPILYLIIIVACVPIIFGEMILNGFISFLNGYFLSGFVLPILISMPMIFENKKLYWGYILLIPLAFNIFFIVYFFDIRTYGIYSALSFIVGILFSIFLKKFCKKKFYDN